MSTPIVFLSPGAGLGHIARANAIASCLFSKGIKSTIIASSPFAEAMHRLSEVDCIQLSIRDWKKSIDALLDQLEPRLVVIDSFPAGIRGEWLSPSMRSKWKRCYLARHLKLDPYTDVIDCSYQQLISTIPEQTLLLETLSTEHLEILHAAGTHLHTLPGPVHFIPTHPATPPAELEVMLNTGKLRLVVHSGPEHEINQLVAKAQADLNVGEQIALIAPCPNYPSLATFDYFPASALYSRALHVYTGVGYNSMAECAPIKNKHTAIPMERHYDDQKMRTMMDIPPLNGVHFAAQTLINIM